MGGGDRATTTTLLATLLHGLPTWSGTDVPLANGVGNGYILSRLVPPPMYGKDSNPARYVGRDLFAQMPQAFCRFPWWSWQCAFEETVILIWAAADVRSTSSDVKSALTLLIKTSAISKNQPESNSEGSKLKRAASAAVAMLQARHEGLASGPCNGFWGFLEARHSLAPEWATFWAVLAADGCCARRVAGSGGCTRYKASIPGKGGGCESGEFYGGDYGGKTGDRDMS